MRTLAMFISAAALLSAASTKDFSKTVPLDANGRFTLDTYKGSIHITAWDQPQAEIQAHIVEDPGWHSMPVDDVEIRVESFGGGAHVKTDYRRHWSWFDDGNLPLVHYTIRVPRGASLTIEDYKSESDISGVQGDVDFHTYKGTARLDGLEKAVNLRTYKGEIRANFAKFGGATHVDTYKGTIDLGVPRSSAFEIRAHLQRRVDFQCDFPRTIRSSNRMNDFTSSVNGGGPELRVSSYRGSIRIRST